MKLLKMLEDLIVVSIQVAIAAYAITLLIAFVVWIFA